MTEIKQKTKGRNHRKGYEVATVTATAMAEGTATVAAEADARYSFTVQFLCASAIFARRCAEIERAHPDNPDEPTRAEHRGLVTAAIMQCAAAVEAESAEVTAHGPGHHLGSDRMDKKAHKFLAPLAEFIDHQNVLTRYKIILHILNKPPLAEDQQPWQNMAVLVKLRNELIHYKSQWGKEMDSQKLFKTLNNLHLAKPPFVPSNANFFPHQFLGAACAAWAVRTAVDFLNGFYDRLGIESPLKAYMGQFAGL